MEIVYLEINPELEPGIDFFFFLFVVTYSQVSEKSHDLCELFGLSLYIDWCYTSLELYMY